MRYTKVYLFRYKININIYFFLFFSKNSKNISSVALSIFGLYFSINFFISSSSSCNLLFLSESLKRVSKRYKICSFSIVVVLILYFLQFASKIIIFSEKLYSKSKFLNKSTSFFKKLSLSHIKSSIVLMFSWKSLKILSYIPNFLHLFLIAIIESLFFHLDIACWLIPIF